VSLAGPDTLAEEVGGALLWWGRPRAHRDALDQVFSQDLFEKL
jgi:hypothetical protein